MKMRIFPRILLATMLPLIIIVIVMFTAANNVIYTNGTKLSQDLANQVAAKASYQVSMLLNDMATLLGFSSRTLSLGSNKKASSRAEADRLLILLLGADPNFYCAWFAFEPGIFDADEWYYQRMIKEDGEILTVHQPGQNLPGRLEEQPKFHNPWSTGQTYLNLVDQVDYGLGQGPVTVGTMAYPIIAGGRVIGVVGLEVRYLNLVPPTIEVLDNASHTLLLLGKTGVILQSPGHRDIGRKLSEFLPEADDFLSKAYSGQPLLKEIDSPFLNDRALACVYPTYIDKNIQPFFIYLDFPLDSIYAHVYDSISRIVLIGLIGLVILFLCVMAATRHIVRPIRDLTVNIQKISRGDLEAGLETKDLVALKSNVVELEIMRRTLGEMLGQISAAHEISLRDTEAKIERERLIASSEAKSLFFASMSHEIRTPMNAVLGIADILLESTELTSAQRKYVNDIKISSEALLTVINDILDLSKMEAGRMQLSPTHFNFQMILDNLCSLAQFMANAKNLAFRCKTLGPTPACLYGDDARLRQILLNLISNAIKYTRQGSVELGVETTARNLRFAVSDTGIGIRSEDQGNLFTPFQQVDAGNNRTIQGTGLGLSITKNLVELMGGSIELASTYGRGSVFTLTIPKTLGDPEAMARRVEAGQIRLQRFQFGHDLRILVVDDNEINLTVAAGLLSAFHGVESDLASSGLEALEKIQGHNYHIIFMDHMMPEMDGVETTRRIRNLGGRYAQIPIIAFTANAVTGIREMLLEAGFNGFLAKPLNKDELAQVLNQWAPAGASRELAEKPERREAESAAEFRSGPDNRLVKLYQALLRLEDEKVEIALQELKPLLEDDPELSLMLDQVRDNLSIFDFESAAELVRVYQAGPPAF